MRKQANIETDTHLALSTFPFKYVRSCDTLLVSRGGEDGAGDGGFEFCSEESPVMGGTGSNLGAGVAILGVYARLQSCSSFTSSKEMRIAMCIHDKHAVRVITFSEME